MEVVKDRKNLSLYIDEQIKKGNSIGFVPTMGALHEGHMSLVRLSSDQNDITVVSIFVNPVQFNNQSDLANYPRDSKADIAMLENDKVDLLFLPDVNEMYPDEIKETYDFGALENVMEGAFRPGHFNGVAIVVNRLFELVKPTRAYFGEKDFQQLAIIKKMVQDYKIPTQIVPGRIIREPDGLAMSSRNQRLSETERENAVRINEVLKESIKKSKKMDVAQIEQWVKEEISKVEGLDLEYFQMVDDLSLQAVDTLNHTGGIVGCIAVYAGKIRLIDNIRYK